MNKKFVNFWYKLSHIGVKHTMTIEKQKKIILSNQLAAVFFVVLLVMNFSMFYQINIYSFISVLSISTILTAWWFNYKGYAKLNFGFNAYVFSYIYACFQYRPKLFYY